MRPSPAVVAPPHPARTRAHAPARPRRRAQLALGAAPRMYVLRPRAAAAAAPAANTEYDACEGDAPLAPECVFTGAAERAAADEYALLSGLVRADTRAEAALRERMCACPKRHP